MPTRRHKGIDWSGGKTPVSLLVVIALVVPVLALMAGCVSPKSTQSVNEPNESALPVSGSENKTASYAILRTATKIVAASDAPDAWKNQSDYICDGTNDEVEINAALAAGAGGHVVLTSGTFYKAVGANITLPSKTWLSGQGAGTIIRPQMAEMTSPVIWSGASADVKVSDLTISGDIVNVEYCIFFEGTERGKVDNVWISGGGVNYGILYLYTTDSSITNSHFVAVGYRSIGLYGTSDKVIGNSIEGSLEGINASGGINAVVNGNTIRGCDDSIIGGAGTTITANTIIDSSAPGPGSAILLGTGSANCTVESNYINGVGGVGWGQHGVYLTGNSKGHIINGNQILQRPGWGGTDSDGISLRQQFNDWPTDIIITDNKIYGWKNSGIYALGDLGHVMLYISIANNIIVSNGSGIVCDTTQNSTITHNRIYNNTAAWGIFASNALGVDISHNEVYGNGGWGIAIETYYLRTTWIPRIKDNIVHSNAAGQITFEMYGGTPAHSYLPRMTDKTGIYDKYCESFSNIHAVSANYVRAAQDLSAGVPVVFTIDKQPDVPRGITFALTHTNITAYTLTINGTTASGITVTEYFTEAGGWSQETYNAYATISDIALTARTGTGAGDTCDVGISARLGLQMPFYTAGDVYKVSRIPVGGNAVDWSEAANIDASPGWGTVDVSIGGAIVTGDSFIIWYNRESNRLN